LTRTTTTTRRTKSKKSKKPIYNIQQSTSKSAISKQKFNSNERKQHQKTTKYHKSLQNNDENGKCPKKKDESSNRIESGQKQQQYKHRTSDLTKQQLTIERPFFYLQK